MYGQLLDSRSYTVNSISMANLGPGETTKSRSGPWTPNLIASQGGTDWQNLQATIINIHEQFAARTRSFTFGASYFVSPGGRCMCGCRSWKWWPFPSKACYINFGDPGRTVQTVPVCRTDNKLPGCDRYA